MNARLAFGLTIALGASSCTGEPPDTVRTEHVETTNQTVASVVAKKDQFSKLAWSLADTQLAPILDGQADYTLLAFDDQAFEKLGERGEALASMEERPLLAAILRTHILPGQVTPDAIDQAIRREGGPVQMRNLAGTLVTFDKTSGGTTISNGATTAMLRSGAIVAINGAVLPVDTILLPEG